MSKLKQHLPALTVALILGLVLGGGAVAAVTLPDNSVGWNKLTPGVQKRILAKKRLAGPRPPLVARPQAEQGEKGERGEPGPAGPSGAIEPQCALVEGDCVIYSNEFWRLRAAYAPYESQVGVYSAPPSCLKAESEGEPVVCPQVITHLYPDGTLGTDPWEVDPAAPNGWRLFEP